MSTQNCKWWLGLEPRLVCCSPQSAWHFFWDSVCPKGPHYTHTFISLPESVPGLLPLRSFPWCALPQKEELTKASQQGSAGCAWDLWEWDGNPSPAPQQLVRLARDCCWLRVTSLKSYTQEDCSLYRGTCWVIWALGLTVSSSRSPPAQVIRNVCLLLPLLGNDPLDGEACVLGVTVDTHLV